MPHMRGDSAAQIGGQQEKTDRASVGNHKQEGTTDLQNPNENQFGTLVAEFTELYDDRGWLDELQRGAAYHENAGQVHEDIPHGRCYPRGWVFISHCAFLSSNRSFHMSGRHDWQ